MMATETREVRHARAGSLILTVGESYRWRGCTGTFLFGGRAGVGRITKIIVLSRQRKRLGRPLFRPGDTLIMMEPEGGPEARFQPHELDFAPLEGGEFQNYHGCGFD